jgi:hypothetical protein
VNKLKGKSENPRRRFTGLGCKVQTEPGITPEFAVFKIFGFQKTYKIRSKKRNQKIRVHGISGKPESPKLQHNERNAGVENSKNHNITVVLWF